MPKKKLSECWRGPIRIGFGHNCDVAHLLIPLGLHREVGAIFRGNRSSGWILPFDVTVPGKDRPTLAEAKAAVEAHVREQAKEIDWDE